MADRTRTRTAADAHARTGKKVVEDESGLLDKLHVAFRWLLLVGAAVPSTVFVPLPLTQLFTRRFRREELLKRIHFMVGWARFCVKNLLKIDLQVVGRENLPRSTRGHMYVSNHQSYVDIVVLMSALDTVAFLSKQLVRYIPLIGRSAYCGGTVFFTRGSKEERERALEETMRMCRESTAVVVFPEGTRSEDGNLREKIYPRAMAECFNRSIKVIPVGLDGTHRVFPKSMDRMRLNQRAVVHIGRPIDPADFPDADAFVRSCWATVAELLQKSRARLQGA